MKKLLPIGTLLFLSALFIAPGHVTQNEIKGRINLSNCAKVVVKGNGYNRLYHEKFIIAWE